MSINYRLKVARKKSNIKNILLRAQNTFSDMLLRMPQFGDIHAWGDLVPYERPPHQLSTLMQKWTWRRSPGPGAPQRSRGTPL